MPPYQKVDPLNISVCCEVCGKRDDLIANVSHRPAETGRESINKQELSMGQTLTTLPNMN